MSESDSVDGSETEEEPPQGEPAQEEPPQGEPAQEEPPQGEPAQEESKPKDFEENTEERGKRIREEWLKITTKKEIIIPTDSPVIDPRWWTVVLILILFLTIVLRYAG